DPIYWRDCRQSQKQGSCTIFLEGGRRRQQLGTNVFHRNEERTDVEMEKLNPLFGYQGNYRPQGFSMINEEAVSNFVQTYGDILGVLKTLERGEELIHLPSRKEEVIARIDERI